MSQLGQLDQYVLLAIMRLHPTAYGVSIREELLKRTSESYSIGAIYAALDRLENEGLVATRIGEVTAKRGGRAKLYFNITSSGRLALSASLSAFDRLRSGLRLREA